MVPIILNKKLIKNKNKLYIIWIINYPEDFNNVFNRYDKIGNEIFNYIKNLNNNILNIIVTHGYGVQLITEKCLKLNKNNNYDIYDIDFCYSFCFEMDFNNELKFINFLKPN
jgi:GTP-binding protein EngB required for normal cell division